MRVRTTNPSAVLGLAYFAICYIDPSIRMMSKSTSFSSGFINFSVNTRKLVINYDLDLVIKETMADAWYSCKS